MKRMLYTRICADCGRVMYNVAPNRQLCPACADLHHLESGQSSRLSKREREALHQQKTHSEMCRNALHADALAAARAGISYGKYMLTKSRKEG